MARPAVFLDRDGTMIEDVSYLVRASDVRWYPYTLEAIALFNRAGFLVVVTTNQSAVGRGYLTEAELGTIHEAMDRHVSAGGARIDAWLYCPHHPTADLEPYRVDCDCRKPQPGLIRQACERFEIDLSRSFGIGDKTADVEAARRAGARGVLVETGYGADVVAAHAGKVPGASYVAADLMAAASWVLAESGDRLAHR